MELHLETVRGMGYCTMIHSGGILFDWLSQIWSKDASVTSEDKCTEMGR